MTILEQNKKKDWNNCQRSSSTHSFWPSWCTAPLYYPTIHSIFTAVALCCLFCSSQLPLNGLPSSDRLLGCPITKSDWRSGRLCWWIPGMCRHTDCGRLGLKDYKAFKKSLNGIHSHLTGEWKKLLINPLNKKKGSHHPGTWKSDVFMNTRLFMAVLSEPWTPDGP